VNLDGFERFRLVGDEDTGVGLQCIADECWDGGRPQAHYAGLSIPYFDDPKVVKASTIVEFLAAGRAHLDEHHSGTG
jgi:hypothetical protein